MIPGPESPTEGGLPGTPVVPDDTNAPSPTLPVEAPAAGVDTSTPTEGSSGGPAAIPIDIAGEARPLDPLADDDVGLFAEPDLAPVSFSGGDFSLAMEWIVPSFLLTVPGFLMIGIGLAQVSGGLAWLPVARRMLRGDGRRRVVGSERYR